MTENEKDLTSLNQEMRNESDNFVNSNELHKYLETQKNTLGRIIKNSGVANSDLEKLDSQISKTILENQNKNFTNKQFSELKKTFQNYYKIYFNKQLLRKELLNKEVKLVKLQKKAPTLQFFKSKNNLNVQKLKLRTREIKEFIRSDSRHRKVYLSDEPPLDTIGYAKLVVSYLFILFWALIILWPIYELLKATFNNNSTTTLIGGKSFAFGFESYSRLFNNTDYGLWFINTIVIAGVTSLLTVFVTLLMGFAYSRFRFHGKKTSLLTVMIIQMIPTMAALTVFYVLFLFLNQTIFIDGRVFLIIIYVGGGVAGNTFIMKGYMDSISLEIDEAAKLDGLSQWKIFTRILIPLSKPMIAIIGLWSFIGPFGDVILPQLLLADSKQYTLAKGLSNLVNNDQMQDQVAFAAGSVITALPISIVFISLHKFLVGGMTAGSVKG